MKLVHETQVLWLSPLTGCDICKRDFDGLMYDAAIRGGPWGNICHYCFEGNHCQLGTGLGQKYELQTLPDERKAWVKVAG